jgi:hypothetical protein
MSGRLGAVSRGPLVSQTGCDLTGCRKRATKSGRMEGAREVTSSGFSAKGGGRKKFRV